MPRADADRTGAWRPLASGPRAARLSFRTPCRRARTRADSETSGHRGRLKAAPSRLDPAGRAPEAPGTELALGAAVEQCTALHGSFTRLDLGLLGFDSPGKTLSDKG